MTSPLPAPQRPQPISLEESPEQIWERYHEFSADFEVAPEPLGSPLLELITPLGPMFAFDRGLSPLGKTHCKVIVLAQARSAVAAPEGAAHGTENTGQGCYRLTGVVGAVPDRFCFELKMMAGQSALSVLIAGEHGFVAGQALQINTAPPIMAFRDEPSLR